MSASGWVAETPATPPRTTGRGWFLLAPMLAGGLAGLRLIWPERGLTVSGPRAVADAAFAVGLAGLALWLAGAWARKVGGRLRQDGLSPLERALFGVPLGLGLLAYGVLALGLVGWLRPWTVAGWLGLAGSLVWRELGEIAAVLPAWLRRQWRAAAVLDPRRKALLALSALVLALALVQALTPPWDADGLLYHLQGPRLFLVAGRIALTPSDTPNIYILGYPASVEMLFTIGLAFGSDTFARLLHLAFGVLLALATFAAGRRYIGGAGGWLAAAILLGVPIVALCAGWAYVDLAVALYELLALYGILLWSGAADRRGLVAAGLMMGLALGSKYLALAGAGVLGLVILWECRRQPLRSIMAQAALFAGPALAVAAPWYLKNAVVLGNPIYPFLFGGLGWDARQAELMATYVRSFGVGRRLQDYIMLPWNLLVHHDRFGTFMAGAEFPSPLYVLAPFYRWAETSKALNVIAAVSLLRFGIWAVSLQQTRHLLPIFPMLGLLSAAVLCRLAHWPALKHWGRPLVAGVLAGVVVASLLFLGAITLRTSPFAVIAGAESKDTFLRRVVYDYPALRAVQTQLRPGQRALLLWDGRGYYCDVRCLPDPEPSLWTRLVLEQADPRAVAGRLAELGVTHLVFNLQDANFWLQHDPDGQHRRAAEFFGREFVPACARPVYADPEATLYEIVCR